MTKGLVINITFMSKLNYVKLSIHNAILLSPLSSQFKTELGTFIENSSYSKLLKKLFIPLESKPCFLQAEGGEYGWHSINVLQAEVLFPKHKPSMKSHG